MTRATRRLLALCLLLAPPLGAGCGGPTEDNRSTLSTQDPAKAAAAQAEAEKAAEEARKAEAAATGGAFAGVE
jgi:hypothetical protein